MEYPLEYTIFAMKNEKDEFRILVSYYLLQK